VKGLLFAAIFSAATATSTLSAMAQTALSSFYLPFVRNRDESHLLRVSRLFVVLAAVGLCGVAVLVMEIKDKDLLRVALNMATYTYGALLGVFLLALLPFRRDAFGLVWGVPFSLLLILAFNWRQVEWVRFTILAVVLYLLFKGTLEFRRHPLKLLLVVLVALGVLAVTFAAPLKVAFPWMYPIGAAVTLGLGVALGRKGR